MNWTDLTRPKQLKPLGEDHFKLINRASFKQHVPMGPDVLDGLLLGSFAINTTTDLASLGVFPLCRHLGFDGHHNNKLVAVLALELDVLPGGHFDASLVLKTLSS